MQTSVAQSILNRIDGSVYQRGTSAVLSDHELVTVSSCSSSSASSASVSFSEPASVSSSQVFPVPASVLLEPGASSAVVFNDHESVAASSSGPSPLSFSHSLLTTPTSSRLQRTPFACPTLTRRPDPPFPGWIPASGSFPSPQCWYVPLTCEFHVGELPKCSECVSGLLVCQVHLVTCKVGAPAFVPSVNGFFARRTLTASVLSRSCGVRKRRVGGIRRRLHLVPVGQVFSSPLSLHSCFLLFSGFFLLFSSRSSESCVPLF